MIGGAGIRPLGRRYCRGCWAEALYSMVSTNVGNPHRFNSSKSVPLLLGRGRLSSPTCSSTFPTSPLDSPVRSSSYRRNYSTFSSGAGGGSSPATAGSSTSIADQDDSLPWYLRPASDADPAPPPATHDLKLPDLPVHPPPLLEPLLQYVAVDLGLDDVSFIDLRGVDPSPALGPSVIMMIATARAEKHLHVSADRLCRWLRAQHKLRPYADGLLGRNELKRKKRRNLRRTKLMSASAAVYGGSASSGAGSSADNGIRTQWVCVNVGRIEPHASQKEMLARSRQGVVGFGTYVDGVNVVVQIFTEAKRAEIDLEGLWGEAIRRTALRNGMLEDGLEGTSGERQQQISNKVLRYIHGPSFKARSATQTQVRGFHTVPLSKPGSMPSVIETVELEVPEKVHAAVIAGDVQSLRQELYGGRGSLLPLNQKKNLLLQALLVDLQQNCSPPEALRMLGRGSGDYTSTPFLFSFYQTFPAFPTSEHWHCRVELHCIAVKLGHTGYSKHVLMDLLRCMHLSGIDVPRKTYLRILSAVLRRQVPASQESRVTLASDADIQLALDIVTEMEQRGHEVIDEAIFMLFYDAIGFHTPVRSSSNDAGNVDITSTNTTATDTTSTINVTNITPGSSAARNQAGLALTGAAPVDARHVERAEVRQSRLDFLAAEFLLALGADDERPVLHLLELYANQGSWPRFWRAWGLRARQLRPHTPAMYACMFGAIARTRHQAECQRVLRTWLPLLLSQHPRALQQRADVAAAVRRAIKRAHPTVEQDAKRQRQQRHNATARAGAVEPEGEWVRWWNSCHAAEQLHAETWEAAKEGGYAEDRESSVDEEDKDYPTADARAIWEILRS